VASLVRYANIVSSCSFSTETSRLLLWTAIVDCEGVTRVPEEIVQRRLRKSGV